MEEEWIKWDPIDNLPREIYFKNWVLLYRNTDEGDLLETIYF